MSPHGGTACPGSASTSAFLEHMVLGLWPHCPWDTTITQVCSGRGLLMGALGLSHRLCPVSAQEESPGQIMEVIY